MRIIKTLSATLLLVGLMGSCSNSAPPASGGDSVATTTTTVRENDGVLLVGAILPRTGVAAELGQSMSDALTLAINEINGAGGIRGTPIRLLVRDEGDNETTAALAMRELLQLDVDAIIGPTSSTNTLATLGSAVDAGILTCSPIASAIALDSFPDNGLLIRTIASDSLQAEALAAAVESTGASSTVVVYVDDGYGRPFAEATRAATLATGTAVLAMVGFTANEDSLTAAAASVVATQAEVVVVIADGTTGPAMIGAIDDASDIAPTYIVNDAVRRPTSPIDSSLSERVLGVSPLAYPTSEMFLESLRGINPAATGLFAHNAYDCLTVIALAALAADSDDPVEIVRQVPIVTDQGTQCNSFATCADALAGGRLIDYSGPGRDLTIGDSGEVLTAVFERFSFDAEGRDVGTGFVTVGG